jgi:Tfp pilus assembly protein PilP
MSQDRRTLRIATAGLVMALAIPLPAAAQSGTTVGRTKEKLKDAAAQAAPKAAGAPLANPQAADPNAAPAQPGPQSGNPQGGQIVGTLDVIVQDPNHISAVKALEQIRRDEEASSDGNTFTYDPAGRRDPFLSPQDILQAQMSGQICEGEGMECWLIQDVTVIGVLTRRSGNVALVIGPDGYGTTLHEGDKLYDGEVRSIDPRSGLVVFRQKINDPTRIKPFRDIEKGLNLNKEGRS